MTVVPSVAVAMTFATPRHSSSELSLVLKKFVFAEDVDSSVPVMTLVEVVSSAGEVSELLPPLQDESCTTKIAQMIIIIFIL